MKTKRKRTGRSLGRARWIPRRYRRRRRRRYAKSATALEYLYYFDGDERGKKTTKTFSRHGRCCLLLIKLLSATRL